MLSSSNIKSAANGAKYYAQGDYYTKGAEETSAWLGKGSERLGLGQTMGEERAEQNEPHVSAKELTAILEGKLPEGQNHTWKANEGTSRSHRAGRDFTFSAPKSVSIAALVADDKRLVDAHEKAVETAVRFLEQYAVARVREKGGIEHRLTGNIVAAKFLEFTSRAQDAQLHTHVVVANMTFDEQSNIWRAMEYSGMESAKKAAGQIYRSELAREARILGYGVRVDEKQGFFEIEGVSNDLLKDHSTRSKEIAEYIEKHGARNGADVQRAKINSRSDKVILDLSDIRKDWIERGGKAIEVLKEAVNASLERQETPEYKNNIYVSDRTKDHALRFGAAHATAGEAVVERHEIIRNALRVSVGQSTLSDLNAALDEARKNGSIEQAEYQTGGARLYYGEYLKKDLAAERGFRDILEKGRGALKPLLKRPAAEKRIDAFRIRTVEQGVEKSYALSGEQRQAALAILTGKDRVQHIQGVGGAGKTSFVGAVAKATPRRGHLAIAKTAVAARGLGEEAGLAHMTVDAFLQRAGADIGRNGVVFIDEASMLGTRAAKRINEIAGEKHFRVVVIGDEKQLPAIEQGKPHAIARRIGATKAELSESRRHKTEAVRATVAAARAGDVRGAIKAADTVNERNRDDLPKSVARYWSELPDRDNSRILSLGNAMRVATSAAVRDILVREGVVAQSEYKTEVLLGHRISEAEMKRAAQYPTQASQKEKGENGLTGAAVIFHLGQKRHKIERGAAYNIVAQIDGKLILEKRYGDRNDPSPAHVEFNPQKDSVRGASVYDVYQRDIAQGDVIQWRHNSKELDNLKNGMDGTVRSVKDGKAVIDFNDGKKREIDLDRHQHWDHGYALTVYKGQGKTFDRAIVLAPAEKGPLLNQDTLYTAVSRARYGVDIWTTDQKKLGQILSEEKGGKTSALEAEGSISANEAEKQQQPQKEPSSSKTEEDRSKVLASEKDDPSVVRFVERLWNSNNRRNERPEKDEDRRKDQPQSQQEEEKRRYLAGQEKEIEKMARELEKDRELSR
ncbi:MAG: MobF family relaxase [Pseudomonadota bacterium]